MRKTIAAVTAGLLLVAGQAAAANTTAVARVGDRVGARAGDSSDVVRYRRLPIYLAGTTIMVGWFLVAVKDDSKSD